jgi:lysophospholipase L1-like esterase
MLLRFRADVVELRPAAVLILAGTNDLAGNAGPASLDQIQDNLASMAELARAHGIRVVLASLLPVSDDKRDANGQPLTRTRQRPTEKIRELNRWLAGFAAKNGHVYLDYFAATAGSDGRLLPALNDDGLHPNAKGYAVMAALAEQAIAAALSSPPPRGR